MGKQEEKPLLLECLGDTPILRMLDFLIENRLFDYSKKQIIEETGLSKVTFYKYWGKILELKLVMPTRSFGKATLYKINEKNQLVKHLMQLELDLIEQTAPAPLAMKNAKASRTASPA